MKNTTLLLAAAVTFSASAVTLDVKETSLLTDPVRKETKNPMMSIHHPNVEKQAQKLPTRATSIEEVTGTWTFDLGDYYFATSIGQFSCQYVAEILKDNQLIFQDPSNIQLPFIGEYDETTSTFKFTNVYLGMTGPYYMAQSPYVWNNITQKFDYQDITGTYNPSDQTISFEEEHGIAWLVYEDKNLTNLLGYGDIFDFLGAHRPSEGEGNDDSAWENIGAALFMDGWVAPGFGLDQWEEENQWNVPLQQNIDNPNLFRLVDPYHVGPIAAMNQSKAKGYIVFDISDPDHVVFLQENSGFAYPMAGINIFYCYNRLGSALAYGEGTVEEIIAKAGDTMPYTTYKNGVVTLSYGDAEDGSILYDANFGYQQLPYGGASWVDEYSEPLNMEGSITFPEEFVAAVYTIEKDENLTPVYFNLQGVRISNPEKGQIVIKKQGKTGKKIAF